MKPTELMTSKLVANAWQTHHGKRHGKRMANAWQTHGMHYAYAWLESNLSGFHALSLPRGCGGAQGVAFNAVALRLVVPLLVRRASKQIVAMRLFNKCLAVLSRTHPSAHGDHAWLQ